MIIFLQKLPGGIPLCIFNGVKLQRGIVMKSHESFIVKQIVVLFVIAAVLGYVYG